MKRGVMRTWMTGETAVIALTRVALITGVTGLVLFLAAGAGVAQTAAADPAALTALRQKYQTLLTESGAAPRARWLAALEALERRKAAEGDWDGAAAVRARRLGVLTPEAAVRGSIVLKAATAKTGTGLDFTDAKKEVVRLRRAGALMEWELPGQTPGVYQVDLVCGVMGPADENHLPDPLRDPTVPLPARSAAAMAGTQAGGVVEFRKLTNLKEGGALLRCSVRSTGGWSRERTLTLGTVELDSKIVKFSLRAVDALPAGVMDFYRLELVPAAGTGAVATPPDAAGMKELARLRELYQKQFSDQTRNLTARYLKSLGELEVVSSRTRDNDTLALVRQEKQRFERGAGVEAGPAAGLSARVLPVTEKLYMLVRGEAKLTSQADYLTRMRPANTCEVTWKLAGLGVTSGTYEVEVECRLTPEHGGTATLAAATPGGAPGPPMEIKVAAPVFNPLSVVTKRKPDGTPGTSMTSTFTAGKVVIPRGSEYLTLRVTSLHVPDGGLFDLKFLRLTPVASTTP